jgi:Fur family peroxide stress response transcriptional regulator
MLSPSTNSLAQSLANSGLRNTPQREVVYELLLSERTHPTADELFSRVKSKLPNISLATVYNCLEALVGCGLVKQVNLERGPSRYCPNLKEHAHLHDEITGAVSDIEVPSDLIEKLRSLLPENSRAAVIEINFHTPRRNSGIAHANTQPLKASAQA